MPRGDGTGPAGAGPRTGRGLGGWPGQGGRGGGFGLGAGGKCVCPACGKSVPRQRHAPSRISPPVSRNKIASGRKSPQKLSLSAT